jgi:hypothetical protein
MTATVKLGLLSSQVTVPGQSQPVPPTGSHRIEVDVSTSEHRAWVVDEIAAGRVCWDQPVPGWYQDLVASETVTLRWGRRYPWLQLGARRVHPGETFVHECGTPDGRTSAVRWVSGQLATVVGPTPNWLADRLTATALGQPPATAVPAVAAGLPGDPDRAGQIQAAWSKLQASGNGPAGSQS